MRKLTADEWREEVESVKRGLSYRFDAERDQDDELEIAAKWIVAQGVSITQFMSLLWQIGTHEVFRLDRQQLEIVHAMGRGPATPEVDTDDLPF